MARIDYGMHSYGEIKIIGRGGRIHVGKYCSIAGDVKAVLAEHHTDWITTYPFADSGLAGTWPEAAGIPGQPHSKGMIIVGHDVWIGYGVTLLGGITIGDGAVIGSGAVVAKNIPPYAVVCGNPAQIIKFRFTDLQITALRQIAWWDWPEENVRRAIPDLCSPDIQRFIEKSRRKEYD